VTERSQAFPQDAGEHGQRDRGGQDELVRGQHGVGPVGDIAADGGRGHERAGAAAEQVARCQGGDEQHR
jgi:hypothetical protein